MPKISCIGNCVFQMRIKSACSIHLDNDNVSSLTMIETIRCKGRRVINDLNNLLEDIEFFHCHFRFFLYL